jgi:hypothetical protein
MHHDKVKLLLQPYMVTAAPAAYQLAIYQQAGETSKPYNPITPITQVATRLSRQPLNGLAHKSPIRTHLRLIIGCE